MNPNFGNARRLLAVAVIRLTRAAPLTYSRLVPMVNEVPKCVTTSKWQIPGPVLRFWGQAASGILWPGRCYEESWAIIALLRYVYRSARFIIHVFGKLAGGAAVLPWSALRQLPCSRITIRSSGSLKLLIPITPCTSLTAPLNLSR